MGIIRYTFFSQVLREQVNIMAIIPCYEAWRHTGGNENYYKNYEKKKTLYILHGGSDDCSLYLRRTGIEEYALERDLAVIFPEVRNSFYSNMVHGKKYFTFLSEELPSVVEAIFPLSSKKEDRFVLGNSMGSHGAFKWALDRPDFFKAAAGMSGAGDLFELGFYDEPVSERVINAFGTPQQYRNSQNDFKYLCRKAKEEGIQLPKLYACCGREDRFYEGAKSFAEFAQNEGISFSFEDGEGGHEWRFWDRWLPVMIDHMMKGE